MKTTTWVALLLLFAFIGLVVILAQFIDPAVLLDPRALRQTVRDYGVFGPVVFILIMTVARMLFVPGLPLVVAGGLIFGWAGGFIFSLVGEMIGATAAFLFARYLGRGLVERWLVKHHERLKFYDEQLRKHGIITVISLRLFNVLPFTPFDIALGLTRVRQRHFIIGTLIGVAPGTLIASYLGDAIFDLQVGRMIAGVIALLLVGMLPLLFKRWPRRE